MPEAQTLEDGWCGNTREKCPALTALTWASLKMKKQKGGKRMAKKIVYIDDKVHKAMKVLSSKTDEYLNKEIENACMDYIKKFEEAKEFL